MSPLKNGWDILTAVASVSYKLADKFAMYLQRMSVSLRTFLVVFFFPNKLLMDKCLGICKNGKNKVEDK